MDGIQEKIYRAVMDVACNILDGAYGTYDDIDVEAVEEDLDDATADF
jgi:hypothetical protein